MASSCLHYGVRLTETISAGCGLALNIVLCKLIFSRNSSQLQGYTQVLACNCFVDMSFCVLGFLFEMVRTVFAKKCDCWIR